LVIVLALKMNHPINVKTDWTMIMVYGANLMNLTVVARHTYGKKTVVIAPEL